MKTIPTILKIHSMLEISCHRDVNLLLHIKEITTTSVHVVSFGNFTEGVDWLAQMNTKIITLMI